MVHDVTRHTREALREHDLSSHQLPYSTHHSYALSTGLGTESRCPNNTYLSLHWDKMVVKYHWDKMVVAPSAAAASAPPSVLLVLRSTTLLLCLGVMDLRMTCVRCCCYTGTKSGLARTNRRTPQTIHLRRWTVAARPLPPTASARAFRSCRGAEAPRCGPRRSMPT